VHYPEKRNFITKIIYYCFHTSVIVGFEYYAVKYTNLIKYPKWRWYWSFITILCTYFLSRLYYRWFFKENRSQS
ncbi:CBO0543 family protein, partial [Pseudomonas sp. 2822-15]|uniref:CBO0543 family protein n=1 Tax=Pseudomonas sp. 2822-15 TaxID=1712677 RepID=UPI0035323021